MAFIDFLYGTTVWKLGLVVSIIVVGTTLVTQILVDRFWRRESRRNHNDIAGFLIAVVGVVFAILVSSLAVIVLARQDRAETLVMQETQALEAIDRETELVAPAQRDILRRDNLAYVQAVIGKEWPQMQKAMRPLAARPDLNALWRDIAALPVDNLAQTLVSQSLRQQLDKLTEVRRGRAEIATTGVDRVIWAVVLLGAVTTILFAILFGVSNFVAHMLMTGLLSFVVALAMIMIIAVDWPYFGTQSIGPDRLVELRASLIQRDAPP